MFTEERRAILEAPKSNEGTEKRRIEIKIVGSGRLVLSRSFSRFKSFLSTVHESKNGPLTVNLSIYLYWHSIRC